MGGPVVNGATERLVDWAIFLQNHARWFPPLPSGERRDMDRSDVSYKRRVLPSTPSPGGWDEPFFDDELIERGERYWLDAGNVLAHTQSLGLWGTIAIEFHVGRSVGGLQARHGLSRRQRLWLVATSPLIAAVNLREVLEWSWGGGSIPAGRWPACPDRADLRGPRGRLRDRLRDRPGRQHGRPSLAHVIGAGVKA